MKLTVSEKNREYKLLDTGIFEANHCFDAFVEYGKADIDDIKINCT